MYSEKRERSRCLIDLGIVCSILLESRRFFSAQRESRFCISLVWAAQVREHGCEIQRILTRSTVESFAQRALTVIGSPGMHANASAMLFFQYLLNNEVKVTFDAIAKPEWERDDNMTPLKKALEHEKYVTASINDIYTAAYEARDFRTMQLLDWFVKEQGEEEKNASDMITKMELFGTDAKGLYMLNSELKARVYAAPSLVL